MRSAPQSRLFVAISLIKAIVSAATFGWWEEAFDLRFQYRRKSSRCERQQGIWLNNEERLFLDPNEPCQQDEEHAIGPGDGWPFYLSPEDDELLAEEGIFCHQFRLASAKVGQGGEQQGGSERFRPMSQASGECMPAAIQEPNERRETKTVFF